VATGGSRARRAQATPAPVFRAVERAAIVGAATRDAPVVDTARVDSTASDTLAPRPAAPLHVIVTRTSRSVRDVPAAVAVVDAASRLADGPRVSLHDALGDVPGVFVADRHNFSLGDRILIRGSGARAQFGVRGVQIVADGIPLTLPDGQAALGNLDLGSAGRIEVLRGPASALYGNAAGGVILLESGPFPSALLTPSARVTAGASGFGQEELRAGGADGSVSWLFHGAHLSTDGWRAHAAAESWRANLVARDTLAGGGELRAVLNLYQLPLAQNPGSLDRQTAETAPRSVRELQVTQGTGERSGQLQAGLSAVLPFGSAVLRTSAWGLGRSVWNPIPDRIIRLGRSAGGIRSLITVGPGVLRATAGLDAGLQADDRRELANLGLAPGAPAGSDPREGARLLDQVETVLQVAPFARLEARPAADVTLSAGLRWDAYRFSVRDRLLANGNDSDARWMTHVSPSAGATWNPLPWLGGYARVGTSFETPTTSELSNRPDGRGGFDPSLGPQSTVGVEAGVRGSAGSGRLSWQSDVFGDRVTGALVPREGAGGEVYFRNAGRLSRRGIELRVRGRPTGWLELTGAWTMERSRYLEFVTADGSYSGKLEPGVPGKRAYLAARARPLAWAAAEARLTWVDAYPVDDANDARTDAYRVLDLRLEAERGAGAWRVRPFLAVDNLFGERYAGSVVPNGFGGRYYEPAPGRSLYVGLEAGG